MTRAFRRLVGTSPLATSLVASCALAACGGGGAGRPSEPSSPVATPTPGVPAGGAPIFNPSVLHEARLDLDPSAWKALRDNYLSNQYYAANISLDNTVVQQVGIRSRGSGSRNPLKPGLRVDFNKYVSGQEFHGYKSLVIDNQVQDTSFLRERLAFKVFEAMGIPAPQNSFARVTVNGAYAGLFALVAGSPFNFRAPQYYGVQVLLLIVGGVNAFLVYQINPSLQ